MTSDNNPVAVEQGVISDIIRDVCELPGDTDPNDPDYVCMTVEELQVILERNLESLRLAGQDRGEGSRKKLRAAIMVAQSHFDAIQRTHDDAYKAMQAAGLPTKELMGFQHRISGTMMSARRNLSDALKLLPALSNQPPPVSEKETAFEKRLGELTDKAVRESLEAIQAEFAVLCSKRTKAIAHA